MLLGIFYILFKIVSCPSILVDTTGFYGDGHAIDTMGAYSEAPALLSEDIP